MVSTVSTMFLICLIAVCGVFLVPEPATATLRGVATNAWAGGCEDLVLLSNVSWYYNWGMQPTSNVQNCNFSNNRFVEFVPMIWGAGSVTSNIVANLPANFRYLMSFNEPNINGQANLLPAAAATLWMQVVTQLQTAGIYDTIKIGAPSASPGGWMSPTLWLQEFFGNCTGCRFDFQNFHVYDCNAPYYDAGSVGYWVGQAASLGLPVWLTEFDCPYPPNEADELKFMNAVLPSLDTNVHIQRYSWFTVRATNVGTIPSLLTNVATNGSGDSLTNVGIYYNSAGDCMTNISNVITVAPCPYSAATVTTAAPTTTTSAAPTTHTSTASSTTTSSVVTTVVTTIATTIASMTSTTPSTIYTSTTTVAGNSTKATSWATPMRSASLVIVVAVCLIAIMGISLGF